MPCMKFTKMHGLGNDYVYVNGLEEHVEAPSRLARAVSDRHTGVGADGLIIIRPSDAADLRMEMYNADGSRAEMCGNGLRCVAVYAIDHGLAAGPDVCVDTDAGIRRATCRPAEGAVRTVRVDMGRPSFATGDLPSTLPVERIIDHPLRIAGCEYAVTCISMGNPHAVAFVDDLETVALEVLGPLFEHAPEFPDRINTHFVRVDSATRVTMKTWERGSGATRACGTGACAVCVAGAVTGRTARRVTAVLPGGTLDIEWSNDDHVYMTGPAVEVFTGQWPY